MSNPYNPQDPNNPYGNQPNPYGQPPANPYGQPGYPATPQSAYPPQGYPQPAYPPQQGYPQPGTPMYAPQATPAGTPFKPAKKANPLLRLIVIVVVLGLFFGGIAVYSALKTDLYSSALTGSVSDWPSENGCTPKSDGFHITASIACYPDTDPAGDVKISVVAKQLTGDTVGGFGIALRRASEGSNYVFTIDAAGEWSFGKAASGTITDIDAPKADPAIHSGLNATNTLEVDAKGTHFNLFVNGTKVGSLDDSTYSSGQFGLIGSDSTDVVFTNYKVTKA